MDTRKHKCGAVGCQTPVSVDKFMCLLHWGMVTPATQDAINTLHRRGFDTKDGAYRRIVRLAMEQVRMKEKRSIADHSKEIKEVSYRRLAGELQPDGNAICDVLGCDAPAICLVGCGGGHPSCEEHAQGADHISPL